MSDSTLESKDIKSLLIYLRELLTDRNNLVMFSNLYIHLYDILEKGKLKIKKIFKRNYGNTKCIIIINLWNNYYIR